jgi:hypothetical protein
MSRPQRVSSLQVESNIRAQRSLDVQRQQLTQFAFENAKLLSAAKSQENIEVRRRQASQDACANEMAMDLQLQAAQEAKRQQQRLTSQNAAIATQLDLEESEKQRQAKEIQRICEESPELRELERVLKIAYLNKERAVQFEERILLAAREQERIQAMEEQMEVERLKAIASERAKIEAKKEIFKEQRKVLQNQIVERQEMLEEARRQTERDREMVDEIVRKINDEDMSDLQKRREMQAATARMVRQFEEDRRRELEEQRAREKAEEDKILSYQRDMQARTEGIAAKKQAKKDEEDRILAEIVERTEKQRREEEEFNNLRDLLWEEELENKRNEDARNRLEKQRQTKKEMMEANASMLRAKQERRVKDAENEARMVMLMRRKFTEDEAKERREEEYRKSQRKNYMTMIEAQTKEKKALTDAERAVELAEAEELRQREEYKKRVVQEARKRLLEEHASRLKGYLPGSTFNNKEEYESVYKAAGDSY